MSQHCEFIWDPEVEFGYFDCGDPDCLYVGTTKPIIRAEDGTPVLGEGQTPGVCVYADVTAEGFVFGVEFGDAEDEIRLAREFLASRGIAEPEAFKALFPL